LTVSLALLAAGCGGSTSSSSATSAARATTARAPSARAFPALHPGPAPAGWQSATAAAAAATLSYPPHWRVIHGDPGTASAALRDATGNFLGYLNATPRQGAEALRGWAAFRVSRDRAEGDRAVRVIASAPRVALRGATAACLIDEYDARVGGRRYRELACFVEGRRRASVFIGAAPPSRWTQIGPLLTRSLDAYVQR
jgi:hypothetical protein